MWTTSMYWALKGFSLREQCCHKQTKFFLFTSMCSALRCCNAEERSQSAPVSGPDLVQLRLGRGSRGGYLCTSPSMHPSFTTPSRKSQKKSDIESRLYELQRLSFLLNLNIWHYLMPSAAQFFGVEKVLGSLIRRFHEDEGAAFFFWLQTLKKGVTLRKGDSLNFSIKNQVRICLCHRENRPLSNLLPVCMH